MGRSPPLPGSATSGPETPGVAVACSQGHSIRRWEMPRPLPAHPTPGSPRHMTGSVPATLSCGSTAAVQRCRWRPWLKVTAPKMEEGPEQKLSSWAHTQVQPEARPGGVQAGAEMPGMQDRPATKAAGEGGGLEQSGHRPQPPGPTALPPPCLPGQHSPAGQEGPGPAGLHQGLHLGSSEEAHRPAPTSATPLQRPLVVGFPCPHLQVSLLHCFQWMRNLTRWLCTH